MIKDGDHAEWMIEGELLSDISMAFKIGGYDISDMCTGSISLFALTQVLAQYHDIESMQDVCSLDSQLSLFQQSAGELTTQLFWMLWYQNMGSSELSSHPQNDLCPARTGVEFYMQFD